MVSLGQWSKNGGFSHLFYNGGYNRVEFLAPFEHHPIGRITRASAATCHNHLMRCSFTVPKIVQPLPSSCILPGLRWFIPLSAVGGTGAVVLYQWPLLAGDGRCILDQRGRRTGITQTFPQGRQFPCEAWDQRHVGMVTVQAERITKALGRSRRSSRRWMRD